MSVTFPKLPIRVTGCNENQISISNEQVNSPTTKVNKPIFFYTPAQPN